MKIAIGTDFEESIKIRKGDVIMEIAILEIDDSTFDSQVLQSDKPVLVKRNEFH